MTYFERLRVPWTWWLGGLGFEVCIAIAVLAYLPLPTGITVCVLFLVAIVAGLVGYGASIRVGEDALQVGRYRVEARYLAGATAFEGEEARKALGPDADQRAFLFTRPFVRDVVRIDLDDEADPHPYWLVSTRRPDEFAAALNSLVSASKAKA